MASVQYRYPIIGIGVFVLAILISVPVSFADMQEDCATSRDDARKITACTEVIESGNWRPTDLAWAYNNRGLAYMDMDNFGKARDDFDRAADLDPRMAEVFSNRANLLSVMGQPALAMEDHNRAISIDASDPIAFNNRAASLMQLEDYEAALPDLNRALLLDPNHFGAIKNRAITYCKLGERDQAYGEFMRGLDIGLFEARWLQEFLKERGHYNSSIDGQFGSGSRSALQKWVREQCD